MRGVSLVMPTNMKKIPNRTDKLLRTMEPILIVQIKSRRINKKLHFELHFYL